MKISLNTNYNVNFGYDKKLNKELVQKISKYRTVDKSWSKALSALNSYCNFLEDSIINLEDKHQIYYYTDFIDLFLTFKQKLAGYVATSAFNKDINYVEREYAHYKKEYMLHGSKSVDWRKSVLRSLNAWREYPDKEFEEPDEKTSKSLNIKKEKNENKTSNNSLQTASTQDDLLSKISTALKKQSLLKLYTPDSDSPKGFNDVAGMDNLKVELQDGILQSIKNPKQAQLDFEEYGKKFPRGILLYGPPGCGKTYITQALAYEANLPMFLLNISKVGSMYINNTSKNLQAAFDEAIDFAQKSGKPCLLFMDEIDSIGLNRGNRIDNEDIKQVTTLLQAMDDAKSKNIFIIGATNRIDNVDAAIRRRFDSRCFVDLPDKNARKDLLFKLLSAHKKGLNLAKNDDELIQISELLDGYSNDSITKITQEAMLNALKRNRDEVNKNDFIYAINTTSEEKPSRKDYMSADLKHSKPIGF